MTERADSRPNTLHRRGFLATAAAGASGLGGCLGRFRTARSRELPDQLSLEILTLPGDADAVATQIGRQLAENLETVGIETDLQLYPEDELRRQVLIDQQYDLFVTSHPNLETPDALRPLLHSVFVQELGWQNPFGMTNISIDDLLEAQQSETGSQRRETVSELQREITRHQPFVPVAVPDAIQASRGDRFQGWEALTTDLARSFTQLERTDASADTLELVSTDDRLVRNLNPIAIEYRNEGRIIDLLYDPLGRPVGDGVQPWAAADWDISTDGEGTTITATLRPDLTFHDGTPLTAADVVFTLEFLADTSLGGLEIPVPAPRFRGRISAVDEVTADGDRTIEMGFPEASPETAVRTLTVPILPKHEWKTASQAVDVAGIDLSEAVTEALVMENLDPVGSGPLQFDSRIEDEELVLARNDDHLLQQAPEKLPAAFAGGLSFERMRIQIVRSDDAALGLLADGAVDATLSTLKPAVVPRVRREPGVTLSVEQSSALYLVGCNADRSPLGNPHFRRLVARLLDKAIIREEVFDGFARPASSPLTGTEWVPTDLQWQDGDPELPFFGTDGTVDSEAARAYLREAGFEFSDAGQLLEQ